MITPSNRWQLILPQQVSARQYSPKSSLSSRLLKTYDIALADAMAIVPPIALRGLKIVNRGQIELALDLLSSHPTLGFDDCVLARSMVIHYPVFSIDHQYDRLEGVRRAEHDDHQLAA